MNPFIGLVGVGYWGQNIFKDLQKLNLLAGVCELNSSVIDKIKEEHKNLFATTSWKSFLNNKKISAVMIALPAEMHYKFAKEALEANKDVFVEKPLSLNIHEAEDLVNLSKKKRKILMVGHVLRYHPCVIKMKELIDNGQIGNIRYIHSIRRNLGKIRQQENVLWSFAPHDISVILSLMNNNFPKKITCVGQKHLHPDIHDVTDTFMEFHGNCFAHISVNWLFPKKEQKIVVVGDKGMIVFNDRKPVGQKLTICGEYLHISPGTIPVAKKCDVKTVECDWEKDSTPLSLECKHFANCCLNRSDALTNGEEGLAVLKVLNKCNDQLFGKVSDGIEPEDVKLEEKNYFLHETAFVNSEAEIGENTKIWHYSHIMKAKIGKDCSIGQNCFMGNNAQIGDNCRVQNNVSIYDGVVCGNNVFLGPSMVFCNDNTPRANYSKNGVYDKTFVEDNVTIGANATITPGVRLRKGCFVGAGAVVTKDVEPYTLVVGNPARVMGMVNEQGERIK